MTFVKVRFYLLFICYYLGYLELQFVFVRFKLIENALYNIHMLQLKPKIRQN